MQQVYGSHSSVTHEFKDMGNSVYPAWFIPEGVSHALEGSEPDGRESLFHR
jgi:hypothetical protein